MADAPAAKNGGISKKVGPLPLWAWVLIGAAAVYWFYSRSSSAAGATTTAAGTTDTSSGTTATDASLGGQVSAGAPADTGSATSDLLSSLGAQNSSLVQALLTQEQDVVGLASAQISALSTSTAAGSFTSQVNPGGRPDVPYTTPTISPQPGTPNTPVVTHAAASAVAPKVTKLKSGATLTTYASGREVEQAPGKTAYVVKK